MKTKKRLFLSATVSLALILPACDSMLDVEPKTDMTFNSYWKTEAHLKDACNKLYEQLNLFGADGHDSRADDQIPASGSLSSTSAGRWEVPNTSGDWTDAYRRIYNANNIIENAALSPVAEKTRNKYVGEGLFFRAYNYFDLVRKYGDVPLVLKVFKDTQDPELKMGRTDRETVIQQCYADLRLAATYLPTRADLQGVTAELDRRRVTRSAALALLARIGLYEGTMLKYHNLGGNPQAHLDVSINAFDELKAEGHALYTGDAPRAYLGTFLEERNNVNLETIFAKAYGPNATEGTGTGRFGHNYSVASSDRFGASRPMIDMYLYADGLPGSKSALYIDPKDESSYNHVFGYEPDGVTPIVGGKGERDPRLPLSFWRQNDPDDTGGGGITVAGIQIGWSGRRGDAFNHHGGSNTNPKAYRQKKMYAGSFKESGWDNADRVIIRWGEMLISYAEALYERNGTITDAQLDETVNALRNRVGFSISLTNAFVSANGLDMREEIRRERTVELMFENLRYNDIIRWKIAEEVLPKALVGIKYFDDEATTQLGATDRAKYCTDAEGKLDGVFVYPAPDMYVMEQAQFRTFDPQRDYFYPIPSNEIAKSEGNIKQNPNWDK